MYDASKREFFCEMIATPYYYWKGETAKEKQDIDKAGLLNALKKKYSLGATKTGLTLPGYLKPEEFKHLADNMRLCGYHYDRDEKEFQLYLYPAFPLPFLLSSNNMEWLSSHRRTPS